MARFVYHRECKKYHLEKYKEEIEKSRKEEKEWCISKRKEIPKDIEKADCYCFEPLLTPFCPILPLICDYCQKEIERNWNVFNCSHDYSKPRQKTEEE